jgi:hypothetical protein
MKELKYTEPFTSAVETGKQALADIFETDPKKVKLVGIILCYAEEDLAWTSQTKMWSQAGIGDAFEEEGELNE